SAAAPARRLCIRAMGGAIATDLHLWLGGQDLGAQPVPREAMGVLTFALPFEQPVAELIEGRLECATFQPSSLEGGHDRRWLGVRVAEVWLES
ncbi:MAG: hypothetical protein KDC87_07950, partial [Planctomycetes bacterium]|nr:hypothetical protein [Planctomycetota bacterium]